ncbi:hypothetical protein [Glycocaulis alkaliphilus]|uniref:hypothetical protein n=1 Tax=Glycocaulis alkaliphilus TaxID=1434191 RepID=UPI000FD6CDC1|nr:hypothetical protein [Glycocaulis alkaliphilus]GGB82838.1 hypothetical protein GCM10007417_23480 [Glycocaulis alkaliphilus]
MEYLRKLLVHGVNEALAAQRFSLAPPTESGCDEEGHIQVKIAGRNCVVLWSGISYGELRVSVWWNYEHSNHPQANLKGNARESFNLSQPLAKKSAYPNFVGATVSGWLERKTGPHLQGKGRTGLFDTYVRRGEAEYLRALSEPSPAGFAAEGKFFL